MFITYLTLRILDIITTIMVLVVDPTLEGNLLQTFIQGFGLPEFAVINLIMSIFVYKLLRRFAGHLFKPVIYGFMLLNTLIVGVNIFVLCQL